MSPELHPSLMAAKAPVAAPLAPAAAQTAADPAQARKTTVQTPKPVELSMDPEENRRNLAETIAKLNEKMKSNGRDLNFSMDETLDYPVVTVKSASTGEVVRQIPNEVVLRVAHHIENMKGLMFNHKS